MQSGRGRNRPVEERGESGAVEGAGYSSRMPHWDRRAGHATTAMIANLSGAPTGLGDGGSVSIASPVDSPFKGVAVEAVDYLVKETFLY